MIKVPKLADDSSTYIQLIARLANFGCVIRVGGSQGGEVVMFAIGKCNGTRSVGTGHGAVLVGEQSSKMTSSKWAFPDPGEFGQTK